MKKYRIKALTSKSRKEIKQTLLATTLNLILIRQDWFGRTRNVVIELTTKLPPHEWQSKLHGIGILPTMYKEEIE
jgi:hypothetical protein